MKTVKRYRIAGHTFVIKGGATAGRAGGIPGLSVFEDKAAPGEEISEGTESCLPTRTDRPGSGAGAVPPRAHTPVLTVETDHPYEESSTETFHSFSFENIDCSFGRQSDGTLDFRMVPRDGSVPFWLGWEPGGNLIKTGATGNDDILRYALWTAYGILTAGLSTMEIHASAIVYRDKAIIFLGESGTGKSTHTRLWLKNIPGAALLNDDSPVLRVENGECRIYGSPWSGKTHCYKNEGYPLASVVRLRQAPFNKITRLGALEAFGAVYPSCPPSFAYDSYFTDQACDTLSSVVESVPVYSLKCLPDAGAAFVVKKTVFGKN